MYKVTFRFENGDAVEGYAADEENLLDVARKTNVAIDAPCSGNHNHDKNGTFLPPTHRKCPAMHHFSARRSWFPSEAATRCPLS